MPDRSLQQPGAPLHDLACDLSRFAGLNFNVMPLRFSDGMPPKIRQLIADLEAAGFTDRGGKGARRNFVHPRVGRPITVSGPAGIDAKHYQVRAGKVAIQESKK